jgi:ubiquinone/menaquinone biosynthesis C-methylase UbiE
MSSHKDRILDQFTRQAVPFSTAASNRDRQALDALVAAAETGPDDVVLDVACGPGLVACAFAAVAEQVTGIDLVPAMVDRASEIAAESGVANVAFLVGDILPLPFADASFSIVVSRFAFHHFLDPAAVLAEMKRVCRRGGRVVVADIVASPDAAKAAARHRMEVLRDPSHVRALTLAELRALFERAGLPAPTETPWRMDLELDAWLERSFPAPGSEPLIRQAFADSLAGDTMGLAVRLEEGRIWFTLSNLILTSRA